MSEMELQPSGAEQLFREQLSLLSLKESRQRARGLGIMALAALVSVTLVAVMVYKAQQLSSHVKELKSTVEGLNAQARQLQITQSDLLEFLRNVTAQESIQLVDPSVDWNSTKSYLIALPAGPRKAAVLSAILLAWKAVPFSLQNRGLQSGLDSPHFVNTVLSRYGIAVTARPGERLSDAMMRTFQKVEKPEPGDLVFYRGNVGSFVVMYVGPGLPEGKGVAVGTLQTGEELQVLDTASVNTPRYPFIGFFRVPYESSMSAPR